MATVDRRDVTTTREVELTYTYEGRREEPLVYWRSVLSGRLSNGEGVYLSTTGRSYSEARAALDKLVSDEGWGWL